jgi:hypothetical protein
MTLMVRAHHRFQVNLTHARDTSDVHISGNRMSTYSTILTALKQRILCQVCFP